MSDEADHAMPKPPPPAKVPEEAVGFAEAAASSVAAPDDAQGAAERPGTKSLVPLPDGYGSNTRRSSVPPGRVATPAAQRPSAQPPRPRLSSNPAPTDAAGPARAFTPKRSEPAPSEAKAVLTPMRIIQVKAAPQSIPPAPPAPLPGADAPTPPDTPAAVASARPPADSRADAPTPPETPALRRELLAHAKQGHPVHLADTQESPGVATGVDTGVVEVPPVRGDAVPADLGAAEPPSRDSGEDTQPHEVRQADAPPAQAGEVDHVEGEADALDVEIQASDSADNLEAISDEELTEVEAVSEREPGEHAPEPPRPPKRPPPPAAVVSPPPAVVVAAAAAVAASPPPAGAVEAERPRPPPVRPERQAKPRRRRLPRTPPRRTSFTGEDGKRRPWWEELWNDDFVRADPPLDPAQLELDVDFIQRSLSVDKGAVVLDLACGAGDHCVELARRGFSLVGYDYSEAQLNRARDLAEDEGQQVRFTQGDVREMTFEQMFDAVYCWNASFGYFEEEKNLAVLANIFRSLKPGGSFLLDIPNRDFVVRHQPMQTWFEGDGAVCMDDMHVDFITSRLNVKRTLMLDDGRNREWLYSLRIYSLHELGKMLHSIGFRVGQVSGDVATPNAFLGGYSQRLIILAVKPSDPQANP